MMDEADTVGLNCHGRKTFSDMLRKILFSNYLWYFDWILLSPCQYFTVISSRVPSSERERERESESE